MGKAVKRDYTINEKLREFIADNAKKPSILADNAGIRRDTFSAILSCMHPIYAEEIVLILLVSGFEIDYLLTGEETT